MLIKNGLVFTENGSFEPLTVITDKGRVSMLLPEGAMVKYSGEVIDASNCFVLPGLTDIHLHGCAGRDLCEGEPAAFEAIERYELTQGVTTICPATMTLPEEKLAGILSALAEYKKAPPSPDRADIVGVHLEGPFISPAKKGAQNAAFIQKPSADMLKRLQKAADGLIKIVTLAPETEGAIDCISKCRGQLRFSIGHTECDYETALKAINAGADHLTHTFNAMPPFLHRETGPIGAAFDTGSFAELICDGVHASPTAVRAAFRLFGDDRIVLISDSMEATGMPDGEYSLGGQRVFVSGSRATLADGTIAGSVTTLYKCMVNAVKMGIPLERAVKAATINPCRSVGIEDEYGSIAVGKRAHLLLADKDSLEIVKVIKQAPEI